MDKKENVEHTQTSAGADDHQPPSSAPAYECNTGSPQHNSTPHLPDFLTGTKTEEDPNPKRTQREHEICMQQLRNVVQNSPNINHVLGAMADRGCHVSLGKFFTCKPCVGTAPIGGYWDPSQGVVVCQNYFTSLANTERTVLHELIHAYDDCRAHVDWDNCKHHACTEIRAANLSKDCNYWNAAPSSR
eukprot:TRINITY_DN14213_c0_g1_i2.p1 TRINITY_DN14213_c0_g1~~TRINITY_DN14213_c0_g1_i2.p1  ORF type:complete len:188 (+),score=30.61 TRINITY_DN14213_c0_g1_i2:3-566(+)